MILTTEHQVYDINTNIIYYYNGGKIIKEDNTLTSKTGYYYADNKEFYFKKNVILTNPENIINSDTLKFNTITEIAYFYGPTTIKGKENFIYCENGWYDTKNDIAQFNKNAYLNNKEQSLSGDSMYYDRIKGIGKVFKNITITDTVQNLIIKGNYAEYHEIEDNSLVTDSAQLILIDEKDSLFLHADTLKSTIDSTKTYKTLFAYHKAVFFRNDLQCISDSIVYTFKDSLISLYYSPILWSEKNQMTAELIKIKLNDNNIEKMFFYNSSFIISQFDSLRFDQIKGKDMIAYFIENELKKVLVKGNAETIYFLSEEDTSLIGINKSYSNNLLIYIKDNEVDEITFIEQPDGALYPPNELSSKEILLKDFNWYIARRPKNKLDIFK
jgi:lipopolysaccharide export system protein LptA